jgi:hypothetical protein
MYVFTNALGFYIELNTNTNGYLQHYLRANGVTNGAVNKSKRCTEMQASCAFLFFGFAAFAASLVVSAFGMGGGGANLRPSRVGRGPAMSQV